MPLRRQFTAISALIIVTLCGYAVSALFGPLSPIASAALVLFSALVIWRVSAWCRRRAEARIEIQALSAERLATLGEAAAGIGHEINNPLAYIHSNLHGLNEDIEAYNAFISVLDSASDHLEIRNPFYQKALSAYHNLDVAEVCKGAPERLKDCLEGIAHIERIVADMQTLSRRGDASMQVADINTDLQAVFNIIRSRLPANVNLELDLITPPLMLCHPSRFAQVIMNMMINALHAIGEETGTVSVRQYHRGDIFYTEISDSGCGMSPEVQAHIFEPFFTTRAEGKGTGIGLALCYKLIEEHQGTISVDSREGEGTRFTLALPVRNGEKDNVN